MSNVTMVFSEDLMLPTDDSGVLIVDNNGNTLNVVSVTQPGALNELLYSGAWTPSDPVPGLNPVTVHYSASVGDIMSLDTYSVPSFSSLVPACGRATNLNALVYNYERIDISWDESADDPSVTYELFRNGESIQTFVHGENSYTDVGLTDDTYYQYQLHTLYAGNSIGMLTDWSRTYQILPMPVYASLSQRMVHSFDTMQTLEAATNAVTPEFNTRRFELV